MPRGRTRASVLLKLCLNLDHQQTKQCNCAAARVRCLTVAIVRRRGAVDLGAPICFAGGQLQVAPFVSRRRRRL